VEEKMKKREGEKRQTAFRSVNRIIEFSPNASKHIMQPFNSTGGVIIIEVGFSKKVS
jgi:dihydroxyacid dehydratase/phosphogluconate dehydratase